MATDQQSAPEGVGEFYDRITDVYAQVWGSNIHVGYWADAEDHTPIEQATERLTGLLVDRLAPEPDQHVLDVGCGIGQPAITLARSSGASVTGISVSGHQVARATERAREAGLGDRVRFQRADANDLPFPDASFDAAWAVESLIHMPDKDRALREVARVLRPGARLAIADMFHQPGTDLSYRGIVETVGIDEYRGMLERAGLIPLDVTDITERTRIPEPIKEAFRRRLLERAEEFLPTVGQEVYDQLRDPSSDVFDHPGFGYVLATARREAAT
ncbi:methyltransferase domain-containing protein [Streptomyces boncukensis]|uniref:Methyltransferase domain-containing protein n=1 Tax=Streptomyces boncukensis TaxID=2711219 RepID=A0A6G4X402_9ACTN|nr:methyltransferase domain-containing protein [Streptomyces boncukensis]NGO72118.1 methyltransferase domain-containing protein [Streptomyces boncukensis]